MNKGGTTSSTPLVPGRGERFLLLPVEVSSQASVAWPRQDATSRETRIVMTSSPFNTSCQLISASIPARHKSSVLVRKASKRGGPTGCALRTGAVLRPSLHGVLARKRMDRCFIPHELESSTID